MSTTQPDRDDFWLDEDYDPWLTEDEEDDDEPPTRHECEIAETLDARIRVKLGDTEALNLDPHEELAAYVVLAHMENIHKALGFPSWRAYVNDVLVELGLRRLWEQCPDLVVGLYNGGRTP